MSEYDFTASVSFHPWHREKYGTFRGKLKLLIVGESFYGSLPKGVLASEFTKWMIEKRAIECVNKRSRRFFTMVHRTIEGGKGKASFNERSTFWNSVAFYNYIQSFVGSKSRVPPSPEMWKQAVEPFGEVVEKLKPDLVLILGERLQMKVDKVDCLKKYQSCVINHPSSRGFAYSRWQPVVNEAIQVCLNRPSTH